jgi:dipeptide/tripeptide permease
MGLLTTYRLTIFLGASLLFLVQPLFARMVLPPLGGTPAVWNTCMLFFQGALLAGYAYAHASVHLLGPRRQAALHLVILYLVLLLPAIGIPNGWTPPSEGTPVFWLLLLLTVSVGGPFFAVSSTSPLLQKWFADCDHARSGDPCFLYVASNVGSMLALIGYPFVIERTMRLADQSSGWRFGYALFVVMMTACAFLMWRSSPVNHRTAETQTESVSWKRRLRWTVLAFVPSSWMLGVTTFLTTDIAPMPLLWIIPLALYLLTFILAFAAKPPIPHVWMARLFPWAMILLTVALIL